jgi:type I restriction enzyme M protein
MQNLLDKKDKVIDENFTPNKLTSFLESIGFVLSNGKENTWSKNYATHNYEISVDINDSDVRKSVVNYGNKIVVGRKTTSNFSQPENLVTLECVNRLLEKGYGPDKIILEKDWPLGHKTKGLLDILVLDKDDSAFLMIECKTYGEEHQKEKAKMFANGGQLFSYLIQEKTTKYLCLYSSTLDEVGIRYESDIVAVTDLIRSSNNQQEAFEKWVPQIFETKGIFETEADIYSIEFAGILKKELEDLKSTEGGVIFNQFAEILRKNVVSDKTNAFNKIFNLFLCKIVDEVETSDGDETKFQWKKNEKAEDVMLRLNDLYKKGMDKYLDLKISAVTDEELNRELEKVNTAEGKESIRNLFIQQKLYTGNEFAFKEVFDKKTFELNSLVVKEVVKILERKRIKYEGKQQFLGDFFERLLNTGIKQEAGQFFTPIPITSFICKSLPIKQIIDKKNDSKEEKFLPYVIDYASGSGHFLTEIMGEINKYVEKIDDKTIKGGERAKILFNSQKSFYLWAKEYVYGIEKDYRLAKTTKISTFLNGDGDANIIFGDGLDSFKYSDEYRGLLKKVDGNGNNEQFDILVANPPYSVSGFKTTLRHGKDSFDLFDLFSDKSSEIECLFIERAKQLIKEDGCVGIILPSSVLTNTGAYTSTREIIFKYFEIKAIVELGGNTFMATNTNTVVLFLKRTSDHRYETTRKLVDDFIINKRDITVNGIDKAFSKYAEVIYGLDLNNYISFLDKKPSKELLESEIFDAYVSFWNSNKDEDEKSLDEDFFKYVIALEREKMLNFFVTFKQKIVLAKTPESTQREKALLGYEFSNRRGNEGIKIYSDSRGKIVSKLYNEDDVADPAKLNSYILKNYSDESLVDKDIVDDLREDVGVRYLYELIDYSLPSFEKKITLTLKKKLKFNTKYPLEKIRTQADYVQGLVYDKDDEIQARTTNRVVTASNIDLTTSSLDLEEEKFLKSDLKIDSEKQLKNDDIFICTSSGSIRHLGKVALIDKKINAYFGGFCAVLRSQNILPKYLYSILNTQEFRSYVELRKGQNINNLGKDYLLDFRFPVPPATVQREIVQQLDKIDADIDKLQVSNKDLRQKIDDQLSVIFSQNKDTFAKVGNLSEMVQRGKSAQYGFSNIQVIKSGQIRGYYKFDFSEQYFAPEGYVLDQRKLEQEDILINSTGVGTAGRVNYFNLKGDYLVDSHVTIVRLKKDQVLPRFVLYSLGHIGFSAIEKMAEGQSGQIELSPDTIKNIKIPLPDIGEQSKVVAKINLIEKEISENLEKIKALKAQQVEVLEEKL